MDTSTIAAIATPIGSGGIGIIRISGIDAINIGKSVFRKIKPFSGNNIKPGKDFPRLSNPESHCFYYGCIIDPEQDNTTTPNLIIDEVMVVFMKAPRTYTREDVVEIHSHSGTAVLRAILDLVVRKGARLATPGEFTYRAFINGRIDLTQAEGIIDIINAKNQRALLAASAQVMGAMKEKIRFLIDSLISILTETEAAIDFPEDIGEEINPGEVGDILNKSGIEPLQEMLREYEHGHIIREGLQLVIAGRPNVGKSSLMNRLLKKEKAIVTPVPGTTRDLIEESLIIQGIPVILTDTAGLHYTEEPVEKIGIEKAVTQIEKADLVLFMTDADSGITKEDFDIYKSIIKKALIWVINKTDLVSNIQEFEDIPGDLKNIPKVNISALHDINIDLLKDMIARTVIKDSLEYESYLIPNLRHKKAIEKSLESLINAKKGIDNAMPFELINIDIQEAVDTLGDIIGITIREDILEHIFSNFCIGK